MYKPHVKPAAMQKSANIFNSWAPSDIKCHKPLGSDIRIHFCFAKCQSKWRLKLNSYLRWSPVIWNIFCFISTTFFLSWWFWWWRKELLVYAVWHHQGYNESISRLDSVILGTLSFYSVIFVYYKLLSKAIRIGHFVWWFSDLRPIVSLYS